MQWWELEVVDDDQGIVNALREETVLMRYLVKSNKRMELLMSDLTDKVDAALAVLAQDESSDAAALDAARAATAVVQAQVDSLKATNTADEAELQKALDALNAAHAALAGTPVPAPVPAPVPDPTPPPA